LRLNAHDILKGSTLSLTRKSCDLEPQTEGTEFDCPVFDDEQEGNQGNDHQHDKLQSPTFHLRPSSLPVLDVAGRHLKIARGSALSVCLNTSSATALQILGHPAQNPEAIDI